MLWLALMTRDTGIPASRHLGIKDEVIAWDFDLAISYRLFLLRQEEEKSMAKRIAYECSRMMFGSNDEDLDDSVLTSEFISSDRYANKNTQLM